MNSSRTIEQLECHAWAEPTEGSSAMVLRCHALRKVSLSQLSPGDCRVLLGQEIGTKYLVPLALDFLEEDPLLEGDYYPGDLLANLVRLPIAFWSANREFLNRIIAIAKRAESELLAVVGEQQTNQQLLKEVYAFLQQSDT